MEYLDTYDELKNYLGVQTRAYVHEKGLWHNTVHCWLYDNLGNIYFQIRKDENKLYTTASGHVLAWETIKQAFGREIKEEIGIDINYEQAIFTDIVIWKMDKEKKDKTIFKDRAFANIYVYKIEELNKLEFDENEVIGLVKVNAFETLELFKNNENIIVGEYITIEDNKIIVNKKEVNINNFLVNEHETAISKYFNILNKVIELTTNNL